MRWTNLDNIYNFARANDPYSLTLRVHDGFHTSDEVGITVSLPPVIRVCHKGVEEAVDKMGLNGHLAHGDAIGACAAF